MGKLNSIITFTGKVGNVIGYKGLDGKTLIGPYDKNYQDSKTPDQVYQRAKLALAAKVAGMLGLLGQQVLVANGMRPNRRGTLVRSIMNYINDEVTGPELGSSLPLVRNPKGSVSFTQRQITQVLPTAVASGSLSYKPAATPDQGTALRYVTALLVYNTNLDEWRSAVAVGETPQAARVYVPLDYLNTECVCYGYTLGILSDPSIVGATASMGNLVGDTTDFSIAVDNSGVAYGRSLVYTQVDAYTENITLRSL